MFGLRLEDHYEAFDYKPLRSGLISTLSSMMAAHPKIATEMALSVLAYNLTRVMNIVGVKPLIAAIGA